MNNVDVETVRHRYLDEDYGGCPVCGYTNGYVNYHRRHIFVCDEHMLSWCPAENMFSCWLYEDGEIWEKNLKMLQAYRFVGPGPNVGQSKEACVIHGYLTDI